MEASVESRVRRVTPDNQAEFDAARVCLERELAVEIEVIRVQVVHLNEAVVRLDKEIERAAGAMAGYWSASRASAPAPPA